MKPRQKPTPKPPTTDSQRIIEAIQSQPGLNTVASLNVMDSIGKARLETMIDVNLESQRRQKALEEAVKICPGGTAAEIIEAAGLVYDWLYPARNDKAPALSQFE